MVRVMLSFTLFLQCMCMHVSRKGFSKQRYLEELCWDFELAPPILRCGWLKEWFGELRQLWGCLGSCGVA